MDASDAVYYPFVNDGHAPGNGPKHCSVRGCTQSISDSSSNKMCDTCRGRHRIYASTKRARRKQEKAAIAARNGQQATDPGSNAMSPPVVTASSWVMENTVNFHEELASSDAHSSATAQSSAISPSLLSGSWDQSIDPRLFVEDALTSASCRIPLHQTSTSSELANALTLPVPPPPPQVWEEPTSIHFPSEERTEENQEIQSTLPSIDVAPQESSEEPTRVCTVKGCKSGLPPGYEFKMCPPCRTRYRTYGNKKRAKWKSEREAFDREMTELRALEDKRRELEGLPPLADNPDELRAWELSVIDEEVPQLDEDTNIASVTGTSQQVASEPLSSAMYTPPMVIPGVYQPPAGSSGTPQSVTPFPLPNDPSHIPRQGPLPARMCTVSHCHKILPGYYRYKRCEQHRLQNRHHSKLKRVRGKGVKAVDSNEGASVEAVSATPITTAGEDGSAATTAETSAPSTNEKGKGKAIEDSSSITAATVTQEVPTSATQMWPNSMETPMLEINRKAPEPKSRAQMNQLSKFLCATDDCENLLMPGVRWRTCEECRERDRLRKFNVRAELKAAENAYWKGVAQTLSAARKASEMASTSDSVPQATTSDQNEASAAPSTTDGDGDDDADGDSDIEHEEEEAPTTIFTLVYDSKSASTNAPSNSTTTTTTTVPPLAPVNAQVMTSPIIPISVSVSAPTSSEMSSLAPTPTPALSVAASSSTDSADATRTYYRKERMEMQPLIHASPTFNSIVKQQPARADAATVVQGQFSKFRVQLGLGPSVSPPMQTTTPPWNSRVPLSAPTQESSYAAHAPKPIPESSVTANDTSSNTDKAVAESQTASEFHKTTPSLTVPISAPFIYTAPELHKTTPSATVPTSAPFVYTAPVSKNTKGKKATAPNVKRKKKPVSKKEGPNTGPPVVGTPANSISSPPGALGPYGHSPAYPYYPYYMPPYHPFSHLPPNVPNPSGNQGNSQPVASSSTASIPGPPNFLPFPYPPQPFNLGAPFAGYPYLPPRYNLPGKNTISGQQPYPALSSAAEAYPGYPYFIPLPGASLPGPPPGAPVVISDSTVVASQFSQQKPPSPKPAKNVSEPEHVKLKYHHLGTESFATATKKPRKKRRKVDPDYLEKHKALQAERFALMANAGTSSSLPSLLMEDVSEGPVTDLVELTTDSESSEPNGLQSENIDLQQCATKTCRRTLPSEIVGKICEKCKLRIKKHQAKTKRRFKLEPRKSLLIKEITERQNYTETATNAIVQIQFC